MFLSSVYNMAEKKAQANKTVKELNRKMCGFTPATLDHIKNHNPDLAVLIGSMDKIVVEDGALDKKTKRLIALACVAVRMCEDCIYPQAKVAKNYGATKAEIVEALQVAVLTGGVPTWSVAKKGITKLFEEWDEDKASCPKK
jgi:4-carboxymuconolactone decarboxylase